ncbi:MAG: DUF429 domain-containing protein [Clostridiales bacterium]|nr:DUF429 domain-containing protein [Clostridiales bacterium]
MKFQHYNCIVVFDQAKEKLLFCKRSKNPYQGLYNFVGGKLEVGENSEQAAYRELFEETGISREQIQLFRLMDLTYYQQELVLEIYVGMLQGEVTLIEEANSLHWIDIYSRNGINRRGKSEVTSFSERSQKSKKVTKGVLPMENFADTTKYAGDRNIAHIVEVALLFDFQQKKNEYQSKKASRLSLGIDGCKGGWIAAVLEQQELHIDKFGEIGEVVSRYPEFDNLFIDMVVGLPSNELQYNQRPDVYARKLITPRSSTIFPVPSRQAVYETTEEGQIIANQKALNKGLSKQTMAIIPKMRELDTFLIKNPSFIHKIKESHPEVCFARLNGAVVQSKKSTLEGLDERVQILSKFLPKLTREFVITESKNFKCNADDIIDAICLAVTADLDLQGKTEVIPDEVQVDEHGLEMQMTIPKIALGGKGNKE